ncbi:hypothetical protein RIF29_24799 [Crotalaria pallida]|uniref:Mechanosensitive channel protein 2/3 transmembrane domain-containing protein n=1 Tax=Crotalaria pallida TaxID=3830 RepID=A0AAN9EKF8_CROPI
MATGNNLEGDKHICAQQDSIPEAAICSAALIDCIQQNSAKIGEEVGTNSGHVNAQYPLELTLKSENSWKKSTTHYIVTSYVRPLLLWAGAILICRALKPVVLPTETGQVVKERLLNFVRSLSTVLAIAYCLSSQPL